MFECCDDFTKGDEDLAYDCKTSLPGGGTCDDEASCKENYEKGLKVIESEARYRALLNKEPDTEGMVMGYIIVGAFVFGMFAVILCTVH